MIALIAKAVFSGALGLLGNLLSLIKRHPWPVALAAALALAWWQSHRADAWQAQSLREVAAHKQTKGNFRAAKAEWARQVATAKAQRDAALAEGKDTAKDAQETFERLAADNTGLRAYIATNRLQRRAGAAVTPAASGDHDPAVPADTAADTLVATQAGDLKTCDDLYNYAFGGHAFATDLRMRGLALPSVDHAKED